MLCGACVSINGVDLIFSFFFRLCLLCEHVVRLQDSKLVVLIIFIIITIQAMAARFVYIRTRPYESSTILPHARTNMPNRK